MTIKFKQGHALLIGVGTYEHMPKANVPITTKDAQAIKTVLCDDDLCGYLSEQVTLLHDEKARRSDVLSALDALAANTSTDDMVVVYYCGHGDYGTDGHYYLTTHDSQLDGKKLMAGSGVNMGELINKLRAVPAKRLLLIFNACHSGEISPNLGAEEVITLGDKPLPSTAAEAILASGEGRIIITACRPSQKSWIGHGNLTIFTQALIDGLRGQGTFPNAGYVSAYGLYEHLYYAVTEAVAGFGKQQEPELTVLRGVGPFPVALFHGATTLGDFDDQESLPDEVAVRTVEPKRSQRMMEQTLRAAGVTASGERSVAVGRDIRDSTVVTGDSNTVQRASGSNIAQAAEGGTATVNDYSSRSVFDQRNQTVHGKQSNIAGDVDTAGGVFDAGNLP